MTNNHRPLSKKRQVQFMIALTILAWATETLRHQWVLGSERIVAPLRIDSPRAIPVTQSIASGDSDDVIGTAPAPVAPVENFMASGGGVAASGTLELRSDATIIGSELKLKQICRWTAADQTAFAALADFVVDRFKPGTATHTVSINQIRTTLQDAGVNVSAIDFVGASICKVTRSDAGNDRQPALDDWIAAKGTAAAVTASVTIPAGGVWSGAAEKGISVSSAAAPTTMPAVSGGAEGRQNHSLREKLIADVALRMKLPIESLQMEFRPQDEKLLVLAEPQFQFDIESVRVRNLGDVSWRVTIIAAGGSQKVTIDAQARAWQNQLIVARPISGRQVIRDEDCVERRTMVDTLSDDPLLTRSQLVGQQASRELRPGSVVTARMVEAVPMVRSGEFVTITLTQGSVQIRTVARAMENGAFGQSIRVRNDETRDTYQVTMTGPQAASMEGK